MTILHEYPFSMVERDEFVDLFKYICPTFKMVSKNTIRSDILKIYADYEEKTMKVIECRKETIAITTDMWTATNQRKVYMMVTAHFIDEAWALRSRISSFMYISSACTLSKVLVESFLDWTIDTKRSTLTIDNCIINDAMISIIKEF